MKGMAHSIIAGHLVADPERKDVGAGLAKFTLAVNRQLGRDDAGERREAVDYFDCQAWYSRTDSGGVGALVMKWLKKGMPVMVSGNPTQERWEQNGQTRSRIVLNVRDMTFLGGAKDAAATPATGKQAANAAYGKHAAPAAPPADEPEGGEVPF